MAAFTCSAVSAPSASKNAAVRAIVSPCSAWLASIGLALVTLAISLHPAPLIAYTEAAASLLGRP